MVLTAFVFFAAQIRRARCMLVEGRVWEGSAKIPDGAIVVNPKATLLRQAGGEVPGVGWKISKTPQEGCQKPST